MKSTLVLSLLLLFNSFYANCQIKNSTEEEIFIIVDEPPRFPGCEDKAKSERESCAQEKLLEFISMNLKYPEEAREKGVEGQVVAQFVINKEGGVENINLVRKIGSGCDAEVIRVINKMNNMPKKWIPGKQAGQIVKVKYTLPIKFKLEGDPPKEKMDEIMSVEDIKFKKEDIQLPLFPGCMDQPNYLQQKSCSDHKLLLYVYGNLKYPEIARANRIEGTVIVEFLVNTSGYISNITVTKDIGGNCGNAATELVESMNTMGERWIPATQNGTPVNMTFTLPVVFKLHKN